MSFATLRVNPAIAASPLSTLRLITAGELPLTDDE